MPFKRAKSIEIRIECESFSLFGDLLVLRSYNLLLTNLGFRIYFHSLSRHVIMHFYRFYMWLVLFIYFFSTVLFCSLFTAADPTSGNSHTNTHTYIQTTKPNGSNGKARQKVRNPMSLCWDRDIGRSRDRMHYYWPYTLACLSLKCTPAQIIPRPGPFPEWEYFPRNGVAVLSYEYTVSSPKHARYGKISHYVENSTIDEAHKSQQRDL